MIFNERDLDKNCKILYDNNLDERSALVLHCLYKLYTYRGDKGSISYITAVKAMKEVKLQHIKEQTELFKEFTSSYSEADLIEHKSTLERNEIPLTDSKLKKLVASGFIDIEEVGEFEDRGFKINFREIEKVYINRMTAFSELIEVFNNCSININGGTIPVVIISNYKELEEEYYNSINSLSKVHKKVIAICKEAVTQGKINCGLVKIINSRMWNIWSLDEVPSKVRSIKNA